MAITINGLATPQANLPINTSISLNTTLPGITYTWEILDQPEGTADALSSTTIQNPTITPTKVGSYILKVTDGLSSEDFAIFSVNSLRVGARIPASGEGGTLFGGPLFGARSWAPSLNQYFRSIDRLIAKDGIQICKNVSGGNLVTGQAVYVSGGLTIADGLADEDNIPEVDLADASTVATLGVVGVVLEGIDKSGTVADDDFAVVCFSGQVPLNTSGYSAGDTLYVSDTPGAISDSAGTEEYPIALVTVQNANGFIYVSSNSTHLSSGGGGSLFTEDGTFTYLINTSQHAVFGKNTSNGSVFQIHSSISENTGIHCTTAATGPGSGDGSFFGTMTNRTLRIENKEDTFTEMYGNGNRFFVHNPSNGFTGLMASSAGNPTAELEINKGQNAPTRVLLVNRNNTSSSYVGIDLAGAPFGAGGRISNLRHYASGYTTTHLGDWTVLSSGYNTQGLFMTGFVLKWSRSAHTTNTCDMILNANGWGLGNFVTNTVRENAHVHESSSGAAFIRVTNDTTTSGSTSGVNYGMNAAEEGEINSLSGNDFHMKVSSNSCMKWDSDKSSIAFGRVQSKKGANISSATDITLGLDGNFFEVTGTTQIDTIASTGWQAGSEVTLLFQGALTLRHNTPGTGAVMDLNGDVDMAATAGSLITLIYTGTVWQEKSRTT